MTQQLHEAQCWVQDYCITAADGFFVSQGGCQQVAACDARSEGWSCVTVG